MTKEQREKLASVYCLRCKKHQCSGDCYELQDYIKKLKKEPKEKRVTIRLLTDRWETLKRYVQEIGKIEIDGKAVTPLLLNKIEELEI